MPKFKLSFFVDDESELGLYCGLIDKKMVVEVVKAKVPQVVEDAPILARPATEAKKGYQADRETVLHWRTATAVLKVFDRMPIGRRPDFEDALTTVGFKADSWSGTIHHLERVGVVIRVSPGAYKLAPTELRSGASE